MVSTFKTIAVVVTVFFNYIATATAGFNSSSTSNIAIYWGQNSHGAATGTPSAQQRLSYYCSNTNIDIIPLAFLDVISTPTVNFANAGDNCTVFSGSTLLDCAQIEEDVQTCQSTYGKTIMLSIGGATYTEGGFSSSSAATAAADNIWTMFGPVQSNSTVDRPFGNAVVDGFDFDFESSTSNMAPFASELRSKMDAATTAGDKLYYLSAAPQCPYPDVADNDMLSGTVSFDFVMVQFYNNYCGLQSFVAGSSTQNNFDFSAWDTWAKTVSKNTNVRVLLGLPGSATAAGSGYISGSSLTSIITYSRQFSSFGGVMAWDMSQVYANTGFLDQIADDLAYSSATSTTTSSKLTGTTSQSPTTTGNPSAVATQTTKTTGPRQISGTNSPTTLTTMTRSTSTGSCGIVSTTTVTSYITVSGLANQTTKSSTTKATTATSVAKPSTSTTSTAKPTATSTSTSVKQWGQCGGIGYTGSTQCESPYTCVKNSVWWAQCQ